MSKIRILNVDEVETVYFYVETDREIFPTYRTDGNGNWERQMGESWESVYSEQDELELQFGEWIK